MRKFENFRFMDGIKAYIQEQTKINVFVTSREKRASGITKEKLNYLKKAVGFVFRKKCRIFSTDHQAVNGVEIRIVMKIPVLVSWKKNNICKLRGVANIK